MKIGCKLQKLRKEKGLSQEELANILGVSRQSVSKWESDLSYPETDKLIKLCDIYDISIDSLLRHDCVEKMEAKNEKGSSRFHYQYISKRRLFGLPLVHINLGSGLYQAKGIIAIGNIAKGVISIGLLSFGIISIGVLGLGLISIASIALGLILAIGATAIGIVAIGAFALGIFTIGALSVGYFSIGALSIGRYVAIGDHAQGLIAIGKTEAIGTYQFSHNDDKTQIIEAIDNHVPVFWKFFKELIKNFIQ